VIGEFAWAGPLTPADTFLALRDLATTRGPDASGYWRDGERVQLGFRRLAILDLTPLGNQPMTTPSGRWTMVYNGEVYNFPEIRARLPRDRPRLRSRSDSEVILHAFEAFGVREAAAMLDGMFAIGLYDALERRLHLIRDFAGIKPLHYALTPDRVVFASQYDQIARHPAVAAAAVRPDVLKLYLRQHFVPAPLGILDGTFQVEAGEIVSIDAAGQADRRRYWELPEPGVIRTDPEDALATLGAALDEAVRAELVADVPVGTFLSGGIDSPLVTVAAQRSRAEPIAAFTIGHDSPHGDESAQAGTYARSIGACHHLDRMEAARAGEVLDGAVRSLREPFADPSIVPTYLVARHARTRVTVALSGDGGDELFFGYPRFHELLRQLALRRLPLGLRRAARRLDRALTGGRLVGRVLAAETVGQAHFRLHSRFPDALVARLFPELGPVALPAAFAVYDYPDTTDPQAMLHRLRRAEFRGMLQKTLIKVDRASMAHSLEVRVPFLKKTVIDTALAIDPVLSWGGGRTKAVLKALLRQRLPSTRIPDDKRGFAVPLGRWIREDPAFRARFEATLLDPGFARAFAARPAALESLLRDHAEGRAEHTWPLLTLHALAHWRAASRG
jgi:asparagine synthase (glutamine-hydrolysing)